MVPLGVGQRSQLPLRERESERAHRGRLLPSPSSLLLASSIASRRRIKTAETSVRVRPSPDYGHFARPWRIDQRLLAAAAAPS